MKVFRSDFIQLMAAGALALGGSGMPRTVAQEKPHPRIHYGLFELREARAELKAAGHDFGGHRAAAAKAVNAAINQLEKALKYSGDKRPFKGDPKAEVYKEYANFPHIRHAVVELRRTRAELETASHDYGGHRVQAIKDINRAVAQLELCIKFAKGKG